MRQRKVATPDELGDLLGIDLVVLGFPAVDGFHIQCMTQDKGNAFFGAQICQPIPRKDAFNADDEIFTIRSDELQEPMRLSRDILMQTNFPIIVQDTDVHHLGVQIDPAVIWVRIGIESHLTFLLFVAVTLDCPPKSSYSRGEVIISINALVCDAHYAALHSRPTAQTLCVKRNVKPR